jgi:hypothetical protein
VQYPVNTGDGLKGSARANSVSLQGTGSAVTKALSTKWPVAVYVYVCRGFKKSVWWRSGKGGKKKKFKRFSSEKNVTAIRRMCSVLSTLLQCARWVGAVTVGLGWHVRLALRCPKKNYKNSIDGGESP